MKNKSLNFSLSRVCVLGVLMMLPTVLAQQAHAAWWNFWESDQENEVQPGTQAEHGSLDDSSIKITFQVTPPREIQEDGLQVKLSADQIEGLRDWSKSKRGTMSESLEEASTMKPAQSVQHLKSMIEHIVFGGNQFQYETLSFYVLKRALKVASIIEAAEDSKSPWVVDQVNRVLSASVKFALKYAKEDYEQSKSGQSSQQVILPYAEFGVRYSDFLMKLNESVLDSTVRYNIGIFALGIFQWDLYRDAKQQLYAPAIVRIHDFLEIHKESLQSNRDCCELERRMPLIRKKYLDAVRTVIMRDIELSRALLVPFDQVEFNPIVIERAKGLLAQAEQANKDLRQKEAKQRDALESQARLQEASRLAQEKKAFREANAAPLTDRIRECGRAFTSESNRKACVLALPSLNGINTCVATFSNESRRLECVQLNPEPEQKLVEACSGAFAPKAPEKLSADETKLMWCLSEKPQIEIIVACTQGRNAGEYSSIKSCIEAYK